VCSWVHILTRILFKPLEHRRWLTLSLSRRRCQPLASTVVYTLAVQLGPNVKNSTSYCFPVVDWVNSAGQLASDSSRKKHFTCRFSSIITHYGPLALKCSSAEVQTGRHWLQLVHSQAVSVLQRLRHELIGGGHDEWTNHLEAAQFCKPITASLVIL